MWTSISAKSFIFYLDGPVWLDRLNDQNFAKELIDFMGS